MVNFAGLIFLTVALGSSFLDAAEQAPLSAPGSLLVGAVGPVPVPSYAPVVTFANPYGPGNTPVWQVPNRVLAAVPSATNQLSRAAAIGFTNVVPVEPRSLFDQPRPRVCRAVPYSMLVVVPGPVLDDTMVKPAPAIDRMRIKRPELELIPWK